MPRRKTSCASSQLPSWLHYNMAFLPALVQNVGDAGGGDACTTDGEPAGIAVVVELYTCISFSVGYDVGIPIDRTS